MSLAAGYLYFFRRKSVNPGQSIVELATSVLDAQVLPVQVLRHLDGGRVADLERKDKEVKAAKVSTKVSSDAKRLAGRGFDPFHIVHSP